MRPVSSFGSALPRSALSVLLAVALAGCGGGPEGGPDAQGGVDAGPDAGPVDVGGVDAGGPDSGLDAGLPDTGSEDAARPDAAPTDAEPADAEPVDAGFGDAAPADAAPTDSEPADAEPQDAQPIPDSGPPDTGLLDDSGVVPSDGGVDAGSPPDAGPQPTWTWAPNASTGPRWSAGMAYAGGRVWAQGGRGGGTASCAPSSYVYEPALDTWGPAPHRMVQPDLVAGDRYLLHLDSEGCGLQPVALAGFTVFDLETGGEANALLPEARARPGVAFTGAELLVVGGGCRALNGTCGSEPLRLDPTSLGLTPMNPVGAPGPVEHPAVVWASGELVVYSGTAQDSVIWTQATDSWRPMTLPAPLVVPRVWASTGDALLVFGGGVGARYDLASGTWSPISTAGGPPSTNIALHGAWTGREWVVLWGTGGAHYDPSTDSWRPANPTHARWPVTGQAVVWTGQDLITYGTDLDVGFGPGLSARYGPQLAGSSTCAGGAGNLQVEVTAPSTRVLVPPALSASAQVTAAFPVTRTEWFLDGQLVGSGQAPTLDTSSWSEGMHVLRFEVQDSAGNVACHDRTVFVDPPPVLSVQAPLPTAVSQQGSVRFTVSCTDSGLGPCHIILQVAGQARAADGALDELVDLSAHDGSWVSYTLSARDARGNTQVSTGQVMILLSPELVALGEVPSPVCDVRDGRALYVNAQSDFTIRDLNTGADTVVPHAGNGACDGSSRLLLSGGAVIRDSTGYGRHFDGTSVVRTWITSRQEVAEGWVTYALNRDLTLLELATGNTWTVATADLEPNFGFDVSAAGVVHWRSTAGVLQRFSPPAVRVTVSSAATTVPYVSSGGPGALWRESTAGTWSIRGHDGVSPLVLASSTSAWGAAGPQAGRHYAVNADQLAFVAPSLNVLQVFAQTWAGGIRLVTQSAAGAELVVLESDGDALVRADGEVSLARAAGGAPAYAMEATSFGAAWEDGAKSVVAVPVPGSGMWALFGVVP